MRPDTSNRLRPTLDSAISPIVNPTCGHAAISTIDPPMISDAAISDGASRRLPTRPIVTNTAITPPAPKAALSTPTPESPIPSSLMASTTNSTSIAPKKSDCEVSTATSVAVPRSPASTLNPSTASVSGEPGPVGSDVGRLRVSGSATQAATAMPTANTATTVPGPPNVITAAAINGPTTTPALSIHPRAAFPAVSSSGVCTATGSSTFTVGRVALNAGAARIAKAYTTSGGASAINAPASSPRPIA